MVPWACSELKFKSNLDCIRCFEFCLMHFDLNKDIWIIRWWILSEIWFWYCYEILTKSSLTFVKMNSKTVTLPGRRNGTMNHGVQVPSSENEWMDLYGKTWSLPQSKQMNSLWILGPFVKKWADGPLNLDLRLYDPKRSKLNFEVRTPFDLKWFDSDYWMIDKCLCHDSTGLISDEMLGDNRWLKVMFQSRAVHHYDS